MKDVLQKRIWLLSVTPRVFGVFLAWQLACIGVRGAESLAVPSNSPASTSKTVSPTVRILGREEVVFRWSTDACQPEDIPDAPARAFRDATGQVNLIATHYIGRRMVGSDLTSVKRDRHVLMNSDKDADPAKFDDREWLISFYTRDGKTIYALVHNEYLGNEHPGRCTLSGDYWKDYGNCVWFSITSAQSTNGGFSYSHAPATEHLVACLPYPYEPDAGPKGVGDPSNIVYNSKDGYYYVLLHLRKRVPKEWETCGIMRTKTLEDPKSWRAWNGKEFSVQFVNPYREPDADRARHICQPIAWKEIESMHESVSYNTYFKKFLLVGQASLQDPKTKKTIYGFCFSLSDNLIDWTPRRLIMRAKLGTWTPEESGEQLNYPSLLDPSDRSRNFEITGKRTYLYYTRLHPYTPKNQGLDRDLVRIPIEFE